MPMAKMSEEKAEEMGGAKNLIRLYVGQEDAEDLWKDLENALGAI